MKTTIEDNNELKAIRKILAHENLLAKLGLPYKVAMVIRLKWGENKTYEELSELFDLSVERIRQFHSLGLKRVKNNLGSFIDKMDKYDELVLENYELKERLEFAERALESIEQEKNGFIERRRFLQTKIFYCDLNTKILRLLSEQNINTVEDLISYNKEDLLEIRGMGKKSVMEIEDFLKANNLNLNINGIRKIKCTIIGY